MSLVSSALAAISPNLGQGAPSSSESAHPRPRPARILITGGRGIGGVTSFAEALREGFDSLGIPVEIIPPSRILSRWRDLRDPSVLKILSTTAVFAAPFARRAICIAHGVSRAHGQGLWKMAAVIASFKIANVCRCTQLVAVSDYVATHLETIFNLRIDAVIRNPLRNQFLEVRTSATPDRKYITYVGVLDQVKNLHRMLPAISSVLDEHPELRACIAGDGPQRAELERLAAGDSRISFPGKLDIFQVRDLLRHSRVFISGTPTEALGIAYIEALSQGCPVAMPASGGGLEIAPELIGRGIFLFSLLFERTSIVCALRQALTIGWIHLDFKSYSPRRTAQAYLVVCQKNSA